MKSYRVTPAGPRTDKRLTILMLAAVDRPDLAAHITKLTPLIEPLANVVVRDLGQGEDLSRLPL